MGLQPFVKNMPMRITQTDPKNKNKSSRTADVDFMVGNFTKWTSLA
jgi:hypothetical protein